MDQNLLRHLKHYQFATDWSACIFDFLDTQLSFMGFENVPPPPPRVIINVNDDYNDIGKDTLLRISEVYRKITWPEKPSDKKKLRKFLNKIIREVNFVCKVDSIYDMNRESRVNKFKNFKKTLNDTLREIERLLPSDTDPITKKTFNLIKGRMNNAARFVLDELIKFYNKRPNPEERAKIEADVNEHLRQYPNWNRRSKYVSRCLSNELSAHYHLSGLERRARRANRLMPFKLKVDEIFNENYSSGIIVEQNEIFNIKHSDGIKQPTILSITGDVGMGKTTLLFSIFKNFRSKNVPCLASFELLFYIDCTEKSFKNELMSFDDYLLLLFPPSTVCLSLEEIKDFISSSKCLILCDGYDENDNNNNREFFKHLISFCPENWKIVVTTRPGSTKDLIDMATTATAAGRENVLSLNLLGVGNEIDDMKDFIKKFPHHPSHREQDIVKDYIQDWERQIKIERELFCILHKMEKRDVFENRFYFSRFILDYLGYNNNVLRRIVVSSEGIKKFELSHIYLRQEKLKKDKIINEVINIRSTALKTFDDIYLDFCLKNYKGEKRREFTEEDLHGWLDDNHANLSFDVIDNLDVIISHYFNIKYVKINDSKIERVYSFRYANELEFAVARKICNDIIALEDEKRTNKYYHDLEMAGIRGNIFKSVLVSKGLWERKWMIEERELDNIFESVLVSNGLWEKEKEEEIPSSSIFKKNSSTIISFIVRVVGIYYDLKRNIICHQTIKNIYDLILHTFGKKKTVEFLLEPNIRLLYFTNETFYGEWLGMISNDTDDLRLKEKIDEVKRICSWERLVEELQVIIDSMTTAKKRCLGEVCWSRPKKSRRLVRI